MADLIVAVVGCGGAGNIHLDCWEQVSGARIAAVCDVVDKRVAAAALAHDGAAAFTDISAMLAAEKFDIVDICSTPDSHLETALAALRGGAHVLCEKPLALTSADARKMARAAAERERLLAPAFCHRFHPPTIFARELIDNDEIGRPVMFRSRFSGLFAGVADTWLADRAISAGGVLIDTGIHGIDLFRYLVGEVASVSGRVTTVRPELNVEDSAVALLQSPNGAIGVVESSWSLPGGRNVIEIYGTAGAIVIDYDDGSVRFLTADQPVWRRRDESGPNRFERMIAHFADAVRGLQPLLVDGNDGVRAQEIVEQVYRDNGRSGPDVHAPTDTP